LLGPKKTKDFREEKLLVLRLNKQCHAYMVVDWDKSCVDESSSV
jgi:hypothetical protein